MRQLLISTPLPPKESDETHSTANYPGRLPFSYPQPGPYLRVYARVPSGREGVPTMDRLAADFSRVYEEHVWRIYGFLAYHVRDPHLAEDLTQATFERA